MATIEQLDVSPSGLLRGMRGEIVAAELAYPDALHVEVRDERSALWRFGTWYADWSPHDPAAFSGRTVEDVILGPAGDLTIRLSGGLDLCVTPGPVEAPDDPPHWELLTPDGLSLEFGPGLRWQIASADDV